MSVCFVSVDSDLEIAERSETDNLGIRESDRADAGISTSRRRGPIDPPAPVSETDPRDRGGLHTASRRPSPRWCGVRTAPEQERSEITPPPRCCSAARRHHTCSGNGPRQTPGADALTISVDPTTPTRRRRTQQRIHRAAFHAERDYSSAKHSSHPTARRARSHHAFFVLPTCRHRAVLVRDAYDRRSPIWPLSCKPTPIALPLSGRPRRRGAIAPDGTLVLLAQRVDGSIAASVDVVSTEQPDALEAVTHDRAVLRRLAERIRGTATVGGIGEDYVFAIVGSPNQSEATRRGSSAAMCDGRAEIVLSRRWLDRYATANDLNRSTSNTLHRPGGWPPVDAAARADETDRCATRWTQDATAVDKDARLRTAGNDWAIRPGSRFVRFRACAGRQRLVTARRTWVVDLAAGSATALRGRRITWKSCGSIRKACIRQFRRLQPDPAAFFVPADPPSGRGFRDRCKRWDCMVRMHSSRDAPRLLVHVQQYGREHVTWSTCAPGQPPPAEGDLDDSDCGGGGEATGTRPATVAMHPRAATRRRRRGRRHLARGWQDIALFGRSARTAERDLDPRPRGDAMRASAPPRSAAWRAMAHAAADWRLRRFGGFIDPPVSGRSGHSVVDVREGQIVHRGAGLRAAQASNRATTTRPRVRSTSHARCGQRWR